MCGDRARAPPCRSGLSTHDSWNLRRYDSGTVRRLGAALALTGACLGLFGCSGPHKAGPVDKDVLACERLNTATEAESTHANPDWSQVESKGEAAEYTPISQAAHQLARNSSPKSDSRALDAMFAACQQLGLGPQSFPLDGP
jgi:hypothetical protein